MVVATLYPFGLKRGVGLDTMREFVVRLRLETQGSGAPSALRGVMPTLEAALVETAGGWEQDGSVEGEGREILGAVAATFLEQLILVFLEVRTGYLLLAEGAADRTYGPGKTLGDARLKALSPSGLSRSSDRAPALMQLAEPG